MEKGTSVSCWEDRRFYFNRTKESIMKMIGKFIGGGGGRKNPGYMRF